MTPSGSLRRLGAVGAITVACAPQPSEPATATRVTEPTSPATPSSDAPSAGSPELHAQHGHATHEDSPHGHHSVEHSSHDHAEHEHGAAGYAMDFSSTERFAAHFDDPKRDAWQKPAEVMRLLDIQSGQTVADVGAGTGYFEAALSKAVGKNGQVIALDAEPNMVQHLSERAQASGWNNVVARQIPPNDPKLPPASVDRILIVNTWHHIANRKQYAAKLAAALRPGGSVLVVDFTTDSDIGPPAKHRLPAERVVDELGAGGLKTSIVEEQLPKQYVVRGTRP